MNAGMSTWVIGNTRGWPPAISSSCRTYSVSDSSWCTICSAASGPALSSAAVATSCRMSNLHEAQCMWVRHCIAAGSLSCSKVAPESIMHNHKSKHADQMTHLKLGKQQMCDEQDSTKDTYKSNCFLGQAVLLKL